MNNVLEDSLFVSQTKKFDEIQSIVRGSFQQSMSAIPLSRTISLLSYRTMQERKRSRWKCFVIRSMTMNYGH